MEADAVKVLEMEADEEAEVTKLLDKVEVVEMQDKDYAMAVVAATEDVEPILSMQIKTVYVIEEKQPRNNH
jgi:hypothetical protein